MSDLITKAMQIAYEAHGSQKDKNNICYINHPLGVASFAVTNPECEYFPKHILISAAILHDVVEDTEWTLDMLREAGMPSIVVEIVDLCTRHEGQTYFEYIRRIRDSKNIYAKAIKLADIKHNTMPWRLFGSRGEQKGLQKRYDKAIKILHGEIE